MKSRACKPSRRPARTCRPCPGGIPKWVATTNTNAWAPPRSWRAKDLHDGHVTARVERRHRSREFIGLLQDLDAYYPPQATIRLLLDNHSAHVSKETLACLATRPNRFHYVHTPQHGSWLNLGETLFGKMARTFLRGLRVESWEELKRRILLGIAEINEAPVVHRWTRAASIRWPWFATAARVRRAFAASRQPSSNR